MTIFIYLLLPLFLSASPQDPAGPDFTPPLPSNYLDNFVGLEKEMEREALRITSKCSQANYCVEWLEVTQQVFGGAVIVSGIRRSRQTAILRTGKISRPFVGILRKDGQVRFGEGALWIQNLLDLERTASLSMKGEQAQVLAYSLAPALWSKGEVGSFMSSVEAGEEPGSWEVSFFTDFREDYSIHPILKDPMLAAMRARVRYSNGRLHSVRIETGKPLSPGKKLTLEELFWQWNAWHWGTRVFAGPKLHEWRAKPSKAAWSAQLIAGARWWFSPSARWIPNSPFWGNQDVEEYFLSGKLMWSELVGVCQAFEVEQHILGTAAPVYLRGIVIQQGKVEYLTNVFNAMLLLGVSARMEGEIAPSFGALRMALLCGSLDSPPSVLNDSMMRRTCSSDSVHVDTEITLSQPTNIGFWGLPRSVRIRHGVNGMEFCEFQYSSMGNSEIGASY